MALRRQTLAAVGAIEGVLSLIHAAQSRADLFLRGSVRGVGVLLVHTQCSRALSTHPSFQNSVHQLCLSLSFSLLGDSLSLTVFLSLVLRHDGGHCCFPH